VGEASAVHLIPAISGGAEEEVRDHPGARRAKGGGESSGGRR
jgi:hypothetical protein